MKNEIEVEPMVSPSGYRIVRIGWPKGGEKYVSNSGKVATASMDYCRTKRIKVIVEAIDYTQWQEPIGDDADYPLPVGTRIEIDLPEGAAFAVVDDSPKRDGANAVLDSASGGVRVFGYARNRWRTVPQPPSPKFEVGDWVRCRSGFGRVVNLMDLMYGGMQYRVRLTNGSFSTQDAKDCKKVAFRAFASAEEFAPHRERWVRMIGSKEIFTRRVAGYSRDSIVGNGWAASYERAVKEFVFDDTGLPVGVEVE